jgi:two-component system, OmpR family, sensor kinase
MGRLFWKFFLAFWLTLLTAGGGIGLIVWLHTSDRSSEILARGPRAFLLITSATSAYQYGGVEALGKLLRDTERTSDGDQVFAVDAQDRDLLGRTVPQSALAAAQQAARDNSDPASRLVKAPDGPLLLLFVSRNDAARPLISPERMLFESVLPPRNTPPEPGQAPIFGDTGGRPPQPPIGDPRLQPDQPPPLHWIPISVGLIASVLFSGLLAWYVVSPIRRLRRAFRAFSDGQLDTRVGPSLGHRRDEFGELGAEFDAMAGQLEALISTQRRFFHDVSHELRSPLARLQAAVGIGQQSPEKLPQTLERIERETDKLDELVGELLTLARLQSGMSGPLDEEIDVVGLLQDIVADAEFEAGAAGKRVRYLAHGNAATFCMQGRSELLGRALENIVRNAVKYTLEGGLVEVEVAQEANGLHIMVADNGPGIPEQEQERIFEPFFRGTQNNSAGGYGLGLAIARHAITMHGGSIGIANRPRGGLQVDIRLPAGQRP